MKYSSSTTYRTENALRYFNEIKHPKYNPIDDDNVLRRLFADRNKNRELIINSHIRLVATIARAYDNADKFMDFNQEGIEGLLEAIDKYDYTKESKFSSYAAYWIRAKMSLLCNKFNMVQRSNQNKLGSKVINFKNKFLSEHMREPSTDEIVDYLSDEYNIDVHYNNELFNITMTSIDKELDEDSNATLESCGEFAIKTSSENDYINEMNMDHLRESINIMMKVLTEKEKDYVIRHHFNDESYESIAHNAKCTVERVRQIIKVALNKMKNSELSKFHQ